MAATPNNTLRIVLVGKTGSGKSATANTILGDKVFASRIAAQAVTKTCQKASRKWKGRDLLVVDTPGLFDTKETLQTTCREISRCVLTSCPGPHAIVLVMRLGRHTQEEQQTVALVKNLFGKAAMKYMIILFTRRDELGDQSLSDFLKDADVNLRSLLEECGDRRCAISNSRNTDQAEKEAQVQELVELIDNMVQNNQGAYFSDPIYKNIDQKLRQQEEHLKKVYADELQNKIKLVEKEYAHNPEEKEKQIKLLMQKHEERMKNIREEAEMNIFQVAFNMIKNLLSGIWHMFCGVGACAPESRDINMAATPNNTLRILLVGKTGSGKSATANTILGDKVFDSRIAAQAVTKTCQKASRKWKGRDLLVVDTPGLFDTKETLNTTCREISRCVLASCPGPHAIVLVMRLGRYTQEEQQTVALVKNLFGKAAMKYMIILFTCRDELGDQSLSDFLKDADVNLRSLLQECGDRHYAISNSRYTEQAEKEAQVQELVELIDNMVQNNQGAYFSDPIYKNIDQKLRQQEEHLKKIYADELQNKIKLVEKEYAHNPEEKEKQIKLLMQKHEERMKNIREEAEMNIFQVAFNMIKNLLSRIWHMFW
ncbi:PREDICTED: uncharacterized protein LOC106503901 [Capra hircus]|uniref:uncharacterized protein LOC106503901 n=1 Tax=Capra hircus TaxID=9925 RepID=UPI0008478363|nr:PREDICTED: uncharacterized protein LOC106503901 [Capra hircus]